MKFPRLFAFALLPAILFAAEPDPLHLHLISGAKEYSAKESLSVYAKHLEATYDHLRITRSITTDKAKNLPGIENVPNADLLVIYCRRLNLPADQMAILQNHWNSGKPTVAIRTASHAWQKADNERYDRKVLGGNYLGHFGNGPAFATNVVTNHPVLADVGPIESGRLYKAGPLAETAVLLQNASHAKGLNTQAVTWANTFKEGRHVYTSLGLPSDFKNPSFLRLLDNAVFWTSQLSRDNYLAAANPRLPAFDHVAAIQSLTNHDVKAGGKIYALQCASCHGADGKLALNPLARRFAVDDLRFGDDPYALWKTISYGNGLMFRYDAILTPEERYQVAHFIREEFILPNSPSQLSSPGAAYFAELPARAAADARPRQALSHQSRSPPA